MYAAAVKTKKEDKSRAVANSVGQKKRGIQSGFGFVDNRPIAKVQRNLPVMVDRAIQTTPLVLYKHKANNNLIPPRKVSQFGIYRPAFKGYARKLRRRGKRIFKRRKFDLAHRVSYYKINKIISGGKKGEITKLIKCVMIPQRRFGRIPKGDRGLYNVTVKLYRDYKQNRTIKRKRKLLSELNSSPFNLRPGDPSKNRSIGKKPDLCFRNRRKGTRRSLSPQSRRIKRDLYPRLRRRNIRSSDMMSKKQKKRFERKIQ